MWRIQPWLALILFAQAVSSAEQARAQQPDTTVAEQDGEGQEQVQETDSVEVRNFPLRPEYRPASLVLSSRWEHRDLLGTGALDLADILEFTPWLTPIRAGFLEGPQAEVFAGGGSVGLRVMLDGYDYVPMGSTGYIDTRLIPLAEFGSLALIREPGGYRIDGRGYRKERPDAYSRVDGGTGDRDANLVRGVLVSELFGAPVGFYFDRVDSRGSDELGSTERNSLMANMALSLPAEIWGQLEVRRTVVRRDSLVAPDRTDWIVRLRRSLGKGWHGDIIAGTASLTETAVETGIPTDTAMEETFDARQVALGLVRDGDAWATRISLRAFGGDGLPNFLNEADVRLGGGSSSLYARGRFEDWDDFTSISGYAALRIGLPFGFGVIAEAEDGDRGLFAANPVAREFFTRVTGGAEFKSGPWSLRASAGRWRVKPSPGLGAPFDSSLALPGGTVSVFEASVRMPLFRLFKGALTAGGMYRVRESGPFLYWPKDAWSVEGRYFNAVSPGHLEIDLRVIGGFRGSLVIPAPELGEGGAVSSEVMNWFRAELVIRILDMFIFWNFEAFEQVPRPPFDVPGFPLPTSRSHFGLKWEFFN